MEPENSSIDLGKPKAWKIQGLKKIDDELLRLARFHAATRHGSQSIRWFFLKQILADPVPAPGSDLEDVLRAAEQYFGSGSSWRHRSKPGRLDDEDVGQIIGYETDQPVRRRQWKKEREQVFSRIGLMFGPPPASDLATTRHFDIGSPPDWHYDVLRVFDKRITQLAQHHAATDFGAQTIRWHILNEVTFSNRPVTLDEIESQLENADESVMADFSNEIRRSKGHLGDDAISHMLGFRNSRPIKEGYYRELRESVFIRIADGFGVVELPEVTFGANTIDIGRQGAWNEEDLQKLDQALLDLARRCARSEDGAQTLRWYYMNEFTMDPEPVDLAQIEQRLKRLGTTIFELFRPAQKRNKPFLGDAKIAHFVGFDNPEAISKKRWKKLKKRVIQRIDAAVFSPDSERDAGQESGDASKSCG